MSALPQHIAAHTFHGRRGAVDNAFRYSIDYVLLEPDATAHTPRLFSLDRGNLASVQMRDHGGAPGKGRGTAWVHAVLDAHAPKFPRGAIQLLTQARLLGHVFNPVSFWLCHDENGALRVVIAEVNNTFGERHSYLCHRNDLAPISPRDEMRAHKVFHVSPFQKVEGAYTFRFDISPARIGIWIDYTAGNGGLIATLVGPRKPLTSGGILRAALRRPFGPRRVLALIHWQALKLWWKGARYRVRPAPPVQEVSK